MLRLGKNLHINKKKILSCLELYNATKLNNKTGKLLEEVPDATKYYGGHLKSVS